MPTHEEYERQITNLRQHVERLKAEVTYKDRVLRQRTLEIDALGRVWCSGGCRSGMYWHSPEDVTEAQVRFLERNAERARQHFNARQCRLHRGQMEKCQSCRSREHCGVHADMEADSHA